MFKGKKYQAFFILDDLEQIYTESWIFGKA